MFEDISPKKRIFDPYADDFHEDAPVRSTFLSLPNVTGISANQRIKNTRNEAFQKDNLLGFTTRELVDLDVITNAKLKPSTLDTSRPIHPLFTSARWEVTPSRDHQRKFLYPLPNRPGMSGDCK